MRLAQAAIRNSCIEAVAWIRDPAKAQPIIFDPFNHTYLKVGEKAGNAFSDGKKLK